MPIDKSKITKEMLAKAAQCETADELIAMAKKEGIAITKAEAEAYLDELQNIELDINALDKVAGGGSYDCSNKNCADSTQTCTSNKCVCASGYKENSAKNGCEKDTSGGSDGNSSSFLKTSLLILLGITF